MMPVDRFSKEVLRTQTEEILRFTTSQDFLDELKVVLESPAEKQLKEAAKRFSPEAVRRLGLKVPENARISSRVFDEKGRNKAIGELLPDVISINTSLPPGGLRHLTASELEKMKLVDREALLKRAFDDGWSVCVCVGWGGCVGVGGGS